jgi:hypothetical protein
MILSDNETKADLLNYEAVSVDNAFTSHHAWLFEAPSAAQAPCPALMAEMRAIKAHLNRKLLYDLSSSAGTNPPFALFSS